MKSNTTTAPVLFGQRSNAAGKVIGSRFTACTESASDLRKRLKAAGVKGKDLTKQVNAVICGQADARRVLGSAVMAQLGNDGFVLDVADLNKKGSVAKLTLVKIEEPNVTEGEVRAMSPEKRKELQAMLEAAEASDEEARLTVELAK